MSHLPSAALVEVAHAWHRLAEYQRGLDETAAAARSRLPLEPPQDEDTDRISVSIDTTADQIILDVVLYDARPDSLRAWATPDLVLLRARATDARVIERLVRLPFPVVAESVEVDRDEDKFRITLDRRTAVPHALFPPITPAA